MAKKNPFEMFRRGSVDALIRALAYDAVGADSFQTGETYETGFRQSGRPATAMAVSLSATAEDVEKAAFANSGAIYAQNPSATGAASPTDSFGNPIPE